MAWHNTSGYNDPTFNSVLGGDSSVKPQKRKDTNRRQKEAEEMYGVFKSIASIANFQFNTPIMLKDEYSGQKYYFPKTEKKSR